MRAKRAKLSRHAAVAKAIDYMLTRWGAFTRFLDDGRICLTTDGVGKREFQLMAWLWPILGGAFGPAGFALQAATIRS